MTRKLQRLGLVVVVIAATAWVTPGNVGAVPPNVRPIGMVCTPGTTGTTHTFNLVAEAGYIDTPDGNSVYMWSYANADAPDNGHFQYPGPVLCVTQGEDVTVNLTNNLGEASSIVFPGQSQVSDSGGSAGMLTREAATGGGTVSYTFHAGGAGTYQYESGSDVAKQVEMGLYGALVVRPSAGANLAYDATTQFEPTREYLLVLAEIDPDLHHAVEVGSTYDFNSKVDRYFTINGRSFPDTILPNSSTLLPNQPYGALVRTSPDTPGSKPTLIRMINAGSLNHPFHPHGNHTVEIAKDGRQLLSPGGAPATTEHFGETINSGETEDFLLSWQDEGWNPVTKTFPVPPPNYLNVTFKDNNTWYSGSPYLGYKGTLPTGTVSQNICGEWYFPLHSHALNEFANYDAGFGGMGTLLRVDPPGGCFASPTSASIVNGVLKTGSVSGLAVDDATYYQVKPRTTTRTATTLTPGATTMAVTSSTGFPTTGPFPFYVRVENEVLGVTAVTGNNWTVTRGQLGTGAATHLGTTAGRAVTALANDWYGGFTGVANGAANLKVTYKGKNCASPTSATCTPPAIAAPIPRQTVKICNWTVPGSNKCSTPASPGWVTLPGLPAQPQNVGSTDVSSTWTLPGSAASYIGTGANTGQVRILVHTDRWIATSPTPFSTWGNLLTIQYDAP
jgi:hypothetical protein